VSEAILYQAHPPMFRNHPFLFVLCVLLVPVGIGILALLFWYVLSHATKLTITDEELRFERGILSKDRIEMKLSSIRSVRIKQSLFQRLFGTGDISIFTAGDAPELIADGMPDPARVRELTG
jgi:uncharacterized membrane protein YdbT with pleckstrin-like domain